MANDLSASELTELINAVFEPSADEQRLAVLVDLPDMVAPDHDRWRERRELARQWVENLQTTESPFEAHLYLYRNSRRNNADLPATAWSHEPHALPATADDLDQAEAVPFEDIFRRYPLFIVPSQFSATAPMKLNGRLFGFRGATMPGFSREMIPALRLDYNKINERVGIMADMLDEAISAVLRFDVDGGGAHLLHLDLRHRTAHRSGGRFLEKGLVGNLPSGEAYIVPYEGEVEGDPTRSAGEIPVQFGDEVVVYRVEANRAMEVIGDGPVALREREALKQDPAYGNMAELGLGVLSDFGLKPLGEILIDEKLGLHIAFGRSDHFGGQVGAKDFSSPDAVVHIDRVYLSQIQPRITVSAVDLDIVDGSKVELIRDGEYV